MAYSINWDNEEKTVVLQQYTSNVSKDDWYQLAQQSAAMLATVSHTVHIIIDERNADLTATSTDMQYLEKLVPPNEGVCIIVVPQEKFLYKAMTKRLREQFFRISSMRLISSKRLRMHASCCKNNLKSFIRSKLLRIATDPAHPMRAAPHAARGRCRAIDSERLYLAHCLPASKNSQSSHQDQHGTGERGASMCSRRTTADREKYR
jgi:hypothetical protein